MMDTFPLKRFSKHRYPKKANGIAPGGARPRVPEPQHELELVDLADLDAFNQPVPVDAREVHRGEGVCADGITLYIHPQAFEVERGTVSCHTTLDPHRRRVADPVMLGAEWPADVHPVSTYLLLTPVRLVLVRGVSEHGVVGIQAHHQIEILVGKDAA